MFHVLISVRSVDGHCLYEHGPGDEILYDGATFHGRLCDSACVAMMPTIYALRHGATFPWMQDEAVSFVCPDPGNRVVFLLKRLPEGCHPEAFQLPQPD